MTIQRNPRRPIVMRQRWHDLLFMHWVVDAEAIQRLLPAGLVVDTYDGRAYVGLVPFWMSGVAPSWFAPVAGISSLLECNVRTYVRHECTGRCGVWFFSLDASSAFIAAAARATYALPYFYASISQRSGRQQHPVEGFRRIVKYTLKRRSPAACAAELSVTYDLRGGASEPARPGSLDEFLIERYRLFAERRGFLHEAVVHHTPYRIEAARVDTLHETMLAAAGIERPDHEPLVHYARQVVVEVEGIYPL